MSGKFFDDYLDVDWNDFLDDIDDDEGVDKEIDIAKTLMDRYKSYSDLVKAYVKFYRSKSKSNDCLKKWYFGLSFGILIFLVVGIIVSCILVAIFVENDVAIISGIISGIAGIIVSILVLPTIIGNYLFPKNEDEYICNMITGMRTADDLQLINALKKKSNENKDENKKEG